MASEPDSKVIDLQNLVSALTTATVHGLLEREHAKGIFKQFLTKIGFNTPRPLRPELTTPSVGVVVAKRPLEVPESKKIEEKQPISTVSAKEERG